MCSSVYRSGNETKCLASTCPGETDKENRSSKLVSPQFWGGECNIGGVDIIMAMGLIIGCQA